MQNLIDTTIPTPVDVQKIQRNLILKALEIQLSLIEGQTRFIGLTYTAKSTGETARFTVLVGIDYDNAIRQSQVELEIALPSFLGVDKQACLELLESFKNSLNNHAVGKFNDVYTKKDTYRQICNGIQENVNDGTLEIKGLVHTKVVLIDGVRKPIKSSPLTIAKNKLRSQTRIGKFRTFCIDLGNLHGVRLNGDTLFLD